MSIDSIPAELRTRLQWVIWRTEKRDGKPTKVPYQVANRSKRADTTDPNTWGAFEEALAALRVGDGGVGYVFAKDDPYVGVDIDGCRDPETGLLEPKAGAVVQGLDSYTEASVSGTGVHSIVKAKLPSARRRTGKYEMYGDGRYFAMTGEHLAGTPTTIEERQDEIESLHFTLFSLSKNGDKATVSTTPVDLNDAELIEKAKSAENGNKFARLWDGDSGEYGDDHSAADLALTSMLAFWTGADPNRIDSLFRASGLYRAKWDERRGESTYGQATIAKALEGKTEVYSAPREKAPRTETTDDPSPQTDEDSEPHSWTPIDLPTRVSEPPEPATIGGIVYPGRRHIFSGEPESLKSMVALLLCFDEMTAGKAAMLVNLEMADAEVLERLRQFGADDEMIRERFLYLEPHEPLNALHIMADVRKLIDERRPSLIVIDSMIGALALHECDPNSAVDIERFFLTVDAPLGTQGAARVYLDHVTKDKETRGKFAIGSERKIGRADVHLSFETVHPFGRGRTGLVKLNVKKDRPGHLPRPKAAEVELRSDPATFEIAGEITVAEKRQAESAEATQFRPTNLMEKVSRYLEQREDAASRNEIETAVGGKTDYKRLAIETLIREGYVVEENGPRSARLVRSTRDYRESDERTSPHLAPTSPHLAQGEVESTSPHLAPTALQGRGVGARSRESEAASEDSTSPQSDELDSGWLLRSLDDGEKEAQA